MINKGAEWQIVGYSIVAARLWRAILKAQPEGYPKVTKDSYGDSYGEATKNSPKGTVLKSNTPLPKGIKSILKREPNFIGVTKLLSLSSLLLNFMADKIKITAIGGSLEQNSSTSAFMNYAAVELRAKGAEVNIIDLRDFVLPLYSYSIENHPKDSKVQALLRIVHASDGFIFASPEYHGTVSAAFKNLIDYLEYLSLTEPPYITGKPVALIAAAGAENSGAATISTMINIVHSLRGIVASNSIGIGSANKQIDTAGEIINDSLKRKLIRLAEELYILAVKLK